MCRVDLMLFHRSASLELPKPFPPQPTMSFLTPAKNFNGMPRLANPGKTR
jgi:hypothetical protein